MRAVATLWRRGPDGSGLWRNDDGVGLGHTRLSILDLTESGAQPMVCCDAEIVITFNGEIYNFREIAKDLVARGHVLQGHSDTEVLLAAYREWGPSCVDRFIGMFAFAIWDGENRRLRLCRDRVGVKPLYYGWDGRTLCFASEVKALLALPHWTPQVDQTAVGEFLQYGYIGAPRSIYAQIRKLPPGHWLTLEADGPPAIAPYWSLSEVFDKGEIDGDDAEIEERLEELLIEAFRYRLVADVPVGIFLSGGIDSSLVAALLHKSGIELEAFTIGFDSAAHDESEAASQLARHLAFTHHLSKISFDEATAVFAQWPEIYDEPFGDHSGIPTYLVARMARERVKVALSADGGDELFCGYGGYPTMVGRMALHRRIPTFLRKAGAEVLGEVAASAPMDLATDMGSRLHRVLGQGLVYDRVHKMGDFLSWPTGCAAVRSFQTFMQSSEVASLLDASYSDPRRPGEVWPGEPMEQIAATDFQEFLPDQVLAKVDRATMAASLEGREPLLDHRVVEFAFRLSLRLRHGPLGNKHILRSILYRNVPRALVDRPKHGFAVPLGQWMSQWLAKGAVEESIEILRAKMPFLNSKRLAGQLRAFSGSRQGNSRLWLVYVLGRWAERWL